MTLSYTANVTINGSNGDDYFPCFPILHQYHSFTIYGNKGNDTMSGYINKDLLYGGEGNDSLYGHYDDDTIYGGAGDDTVVGGQGQDVLYGGAGTNMTYGGYGNDSLYAEAGSNDRLQGGLGNDYLYSSSDQGRLYGDQGDDTLILAGTAGLLLSGGDGNDTLTGQGILNGDNGDDVIHAQNGSVITGGAGQDTMQGSAGRDSFIFNQGDVNTGQTDLVQNFSQGQDLINLRLIDANITAGGNQKFLFNGTNAQAHSVWYETGSGTSIYADVNGDTQADFQLSLDTVLTMIGSDFIL